jgi:hypothetical protein
MDDRFRVRDVMPGEYIKALGMNTGVVKSFLVHTKSTVHEKLINGEWLLHNEKGPAIIGTYSYNRYMGGHYLEGMFYYEKEFLAKTTKLGKVLYG